MINGASRYRHFDNLRGDAVTASCFGLRRLLSCDAVRRDLKSVPADAGLKWAWESNLRLVEPLIDQDYILDLDPTVKPVYGHQEGAEFGYNPQKPGRRSLCCHTLCIASLRIVLGVVVHSGGETAGVHSGEMLEDYLHWLSGRFRPRLVRGDVGFGNEGIIGCCERNATRYLFKVRRTRTVRDVFRSLLSDAGAWQDAGKGWQCAESRLTLAGWGRARRVLFARRPVEDMPRRRKDPPRRHLVQTAIPGLELVFSDDKRFDGGYEWHALATDLDLPPRDVMQLYRDRGDCENIFDEMKNQWGWGGFMTQDLKRTALLAGLNAIAANLWNVFCRLGEDGSHREAATSRPLLQQCVARISSHGRRSLVTFYTAGKDAARRIYEDIARVLNAVVATASQLEPERRWLLIVYYAFRRYQLILREYPPEIGSQLMLRIG